MSRVVSCRLQFDFRAGRGCQLSSSVADRTAGYCHYAITNVVALVASTVNTRYRINHVTGTHFRCIVNTRYRHKLGTPKKCACIVIIAIRAHMSLYRRNLKFCSQNSSFGGFFSGFFNGFFWLFFFKVFVFGEFDDLRITSPNAYFRCGIPRLGRGASPCFSENVLCAGKGLYV